MSRRASLVVFLSLAGAVLLMAGISAGAAQEDNRSKRSEVGDARERLMQARMEQSAAYESYNAALGELNRLDGEVAGAEEKLQAAEERFTRARIELEERASQVYKSGNVAFMDVLVGVDDFSDFATRLDLWVKLLEEERAEFENVQQARDELQAQKDRLEAQRTQRAEAIEAAIDRKEQAENAEAEAQAYLDSLSGELRSLIQAEQERRAAEARANAEKLRERFVQSAKVEAGPAPEPAPAPVAQTEEPPEQRLSLQAQRPAPKPAEQQPQAVSLQAPQEAAPEPKSAPEPQPDPEFLAQQEEAERLAAERRAAAERAKAEQAEAERQAALAAQRAEAQQKAQQKAAERREARKRAAAAEAAQRRAEQAAIEQAAAELAAQQAAERRAQRQAKLQAQRQAELEAQRQAELETQQAAEWEAQQAADLEAQRQVDLRAQRQEEQDSAEGQYEAETAPVETGAVPVESAPTGSGPPASASGNAVVAEAAKYLGTPYVLGGWESCLPYEMMDCSCLTATVYEVFGISMPDSPGGQMGYGVPVSGPPAAGDLVFWSEDGSGYITHVGIAMGDGTTLHASAYAAFTVSGTPIDAIPGYVGARRLL